MENSSWCFPPSLFSSLASETMETLLKQIVHNMNDIDFKFCNSI